MYIKIKRKAFNKKTFYKWYIKKGCYMFNIYGLGVIICINGGLKK